MMLNRHLFLIGMPGCGKSSLGRRVARETGVPFADLDEMISKASGMTVSDFFAAYGEETFRRAETRALAEVTRARPMIVSTGGGIVMREVNRKIMRGWGTILLIDRPLEDILGDIRMEGRPLFRDGGPEKVREVYAQRDPVYRAAADIVLRNDQGYAAAVRALIRLLRDRFDVP